MYRYAACTILLLFNLLSHSADAQVKWIANAQFAGMPSISLYDLTAENKPLILAVGNIHTLASERLFESHLLQKLVRDHSATTEFTTRDMNVAFLNVLVFADEQALSSLQEVPVLNMDESDVALFLPGWDGLYSISGTGLYLITPDHLVYKLDATNADAVYASVQAMGSKIHPLADPDVRLLDVRTDIKSGLVHVSVQNFSKNPLHHVRINVQRAGAVIASADFNGMIAALGAAVIDVPIAKQVMPGNVEVTALVIGDANHLNNVWVGNLMPESQPVVAGNVAR